MQVNWIIEPSKTDESYTELRDEVLRQDMNGIVIPFKMGALMEYNLRDLFGEKDCVIFQGGMGFALYLLKTFKWVPLAWLTLENYKCSTYYSHLGKYLLNENYIIMPSKEVFRNEDRIFNEYFPNSTGVFIRPDTGVKTLNARVHNKEGFLESYGPSSIMCFPESLVVISEVKEIETEWRFICADKEIITGCQYKKNGETNIKSGYPKEAFELAREIAITYQPDPMFTVDICFSPHRGYKLVELNSFSCAGLYACDIPVIVKEATEIAIREWSEIYG